MEFDATAILAQPALAVLFEAVARRIVLVVTSEHPFWRSNGWKPLRDLRAGNRVWAGDGWAEMTAIVNTNRRKTVYNFNVDDFHSYFVGTAGLWVHNGSCVAIVRAISRSLPTANCRFECIKHAKDLIKALRRQGIHSREPTLDTAKRNVYSNAFRIIGKLGVLHKAVQVGDVVFCNMHRSGLQNFDWIDDFGGPVFTNPPHATLTAKPFLRRAMEDVMLLRTAISDIRQRPGMFLFRESLKELDTFLSGICYGLDLARTLKDALHCSELSSFRKWLIKRLDSDDRQSFADMVLVAENNNDEAAFARFFVLWDEFLQGR